MPTLSGVVGTYSKEDLDVTIEVVRVRIRRAGAVAPYSKDEFDEPSGIHSVGELLAKCVPAADRLLAAGDE